MRRTAPLLALLVLAAGPARASSPGAWTAHDDAVRRACTAASGLRAPRTSAPVPFSDATGARTAVLVTGGWPQARLRGRTGAMLCLFDRRSGKAEAVEATGWTAAPAR